MNVDAQCNTCSKSIDKTKTRSKNLAKKLRKMKNAIGFLNADVQQLVNVALHEA